MFSIVVRVWLWFSTILSELTSSGVWNINKRLYFYERKSNSGTDGCIHISFEAPGGLLRNATSQSMLRLAKNSAGDKTKPESWRESCFTQSKAAESAGASEKLQRRPSVSIFPFISIFFSLAVAFPAPPNLPSIRGFFRRLSTAWCSF